MIDIFSLIYIFLLRNICHFLKGNKFCDFLFGSLEDEALPKEVYLSVELTPNEIGGKNKRVGASDSVPIDLKWFVHIIMTLSNGT